MLSNQHTLHSALLSANETSAHETSFSEYRTNTLRQYDDRGRRRRRPADSLSMRQQLITSLQQQYTDIRVIKIKDSGTLFIARIKTRDGQTIHRTAFTLPNLAQRLYDGLSYRLS